MRSRRTRLPPLPARPGSAPNDIPVTSSSPPLLWRALATAVAALPRSWLSAPAAVLACLVGSILRIRRAHAIAAIRRAAIPNPRSVGADAYRSLACTVFETLWIAGRPAQSLQNMVELDPSARQLLQRCAQHGRGLVVASAHSGNWDLLACAIASTIPVTVVTRHMSWTSADRFWQHTRARRGVAAVETAGVMRAAAAAMAHGGVFAFMVDQAPERDRAVAQTTFLGATAHVDLAFALVAMRYRAPVALVVDERLPDGRHRMHVPLVLEPPAHPSRAWPREAAVRVTEALDTFVREHPGQWLWLHRRWKPLPSKADASTLLPRVSLEQPQ
jgi:Kdo2-lipid IVA lauroyltransferase/acyltransferase